MSATEIRDLVLQLPADQRASLARDLLSSLDGSAENFEGEWTAEAESRAEAYAAGQIVARDWEASLARARGIVSQGE
jgi:putative addiction module component (TIGR02574 family)